MIVLLLAACGETPGTGPVTRYTLHLQPVVPFNEAPFEGSDRTQLLVEAPGQEPATYDLGALVSGDTSVASDLPELVDATLTVTAWREDVVVAWGRAGPVSLGDGELDVAMLVARPGEVAWLSALPGTTYRPGLAAIGDGAFVAMGGVSESANGGLTREVDDIYTLDLAPPDEALAFAEAGKLPTWTDYNGSEHDGRFGFELQPITLPGDDEGKLVLAGGSAGGGLEDATSVTAGVFLYDPASGEFELLRDRDSLAYPRSEYISSVNAQGSIVYWGGWGATSDPRLVSYVSNVEIYDPVNRRFTDAGVVNTLGQVDAAIAGLGTDGTLICGGGRLGDFSGDGGVDFVTYGGCVTVGLNGTIAEARPLPESRVGPAMVTLADGRVMLSGGATSPDVPRIPNNPPDELPATDTVWLYNPNNDTWADGGTLLLPRAGHRASLLPDGRVLVVGGASTYLMSGLATEPLSCVEIFDPARGSSTMVGSCDETDDAGGLAGRAWQPNLAVDPVYGVLVIGGGASATAAQDAVSLYVP
jgi:hypothetical protein